MTTPPAFSWTSGGLHPEVLAGLALLALAWLLAWRSRRQRVRSSDAALFGTGLLALVVALNGPIHDLSDYYLLAGHMVQHILLTLVAAPLLVAGTPGWMIDRVLHRSGRGRRFIAQVTRPLPALALYTVALVGWHLPGPYNAALEVHALHVVEHVLLLATAIVVWWPVLARSALAPALPYGGQILYLFAFGLPMTAVAAMITGAEHVLYPFYADASRLFGLDPLTDQRLGGLIMWIPAGLIPLVAFTVVFFRWAIAEAEPAD